MSEYVTTADCAAASGKLADKIDNLEKRLYIDNGSPCVQTRLDRMEQGIRMMMRFGWLLLAVVLAQAGPKLYDAVLGALAR